MYHRPDLAERRANRPLVANTSESVLSATHQRNEFGQLKPPRGRLPLPERAAVIAHAVLGSQSRYRALFSLEEGIER